MILDEVERLLHERIGLDAGTLGASAVGYALKQRMAACGLADPADYLHRLAAAPQEVQELVNAIVVPETWFFRDPKAFAAMVQHVLAHRAPGRPVRLVSVPCSTGEEPYSMAMALFDAGLGAADFTIDAIDISTRNLVEAERAVYGRNSFRGADLSYRARHFDEVQGGWRPHEAIRRQVRFRPGNLLEGPLDPEPYDIVFCRNLLIYFDRATQERALGRLHRMLAPKGMLAVGSGESGLPLFHGFASLRVPMAFAFVRQDAMPPKPAVPPARLRSPAPVRQQAPARIAVQPVAAAPVPVPVRAITPPPDPAGASLAAIERAADAGRLGDARQAARRHLEAFGPSAGAYYLLGLACDADGAADEAVEAYRKALYLQPDHREALAQIALLMRRRGDLASARAFRDRLDRIEKRSDGR